MAKAYWIACYRSISNPAALADYAKLAGPAIIAGGGRFLARGGTAKTYEAGIDQRTVLIEFPSVAQAIAVYDSPGYQAALAALGNAAERDMGIVEGMTELGAGVIGEHRPTAREYSRSRTRRRCRTGSRPSICGTWSGIIMYW